MLSSLTQYEKVPLYQQMPKTYRIKLVVSYVLLLFGISMLIHVMLDDFSHYSLILSIYVYTGIIAILWTLAITVPSFAIWYHRLTLATMVVFFITFTLLSLFIKKSFFDPSDIQIQRMILLILVIIFVVVGIALYAKVLEYQGAWRMKMNEEIRVARLLQSRFVVPVHLVTEDLKVAGETVPASEAGGDYIDCLKDEDGVLLVVADVSGHGIGTIAVVGMLKSTLKALWISQRDLPGTLEKTNRLFRENTSKNIFISLAAIHIQPSIRRATVAIAGHLPALYLSTGRDELKEIHGHSTAIGLTDKPVFWVQEIGLSAGDRFLLITDGMIEAVNHKNEEYGFDRIKSFFRDNPHLEPELFLEKIKDDLEAFRSGVKNNRREDDYSVLCAEIR